MLMLIDLEVIPHNGLPFLDNVGPPPFNDLDDSHVSTQEGTATTKAHGYDDVREGPSPP